MSSSWTSARSKGTDIILARFAKATCRPARPGPAVHDRGPLRPLSSASATARSTRPAPPPGAEQAGERLAAPVPDPRRLEGTIAQATHVTLASATPATSAAEYRAWSTYTAAAAINLIRLDAWPGPASRWTGPGPPTCSGWTSRMKPENMTTNKPTGSGMAPTTCSRRSNYSFELEPRYGIEP